MEKVAPGLGQLTSSQLQELAGNSFSLPIMTLVSTLYWLVPNAPWWEARDAVHDSDSEVGN